MNGAGSREPAWIMRIVPACSTINIRFVPSSGTSKPTGRFSPVSKAESRSGGGGVNCCPGLEFVLELTPQPKSRPASASTTAKPVRSSPNSLIAVSLRRAYHGGESRGDSHSSALLPYSPGRPFELTPLSESWVCDPVAEAQTRFPIQRAPGEWRPHWRHAGPWTGSRLFRRNQINDAIDQSRDIDGMG